MAESIAMLLDEANRQLAGRTGNPRLDAELLLAHCLGVGRSHLYARPECGIAPNAVDSYRELLAQRVAGVPLAYLLGEKEFWSLSLRVSPDTLIPRPETELLVEMALSRLQGAERIAELGTGCGAIAIALAHELPAASITATEQSTAALEVARANAVTHDAGRIHFVRGNIDDWFEPLGSQAFDLILSNPPYVADADAGFNHGEIRFEPRTALAAGPDGLDALQAIIAGVGPYLHHGGWLLLEHGADQGQAVRAALEAAGFCDIETRCDLAGLERATAGRTAPAGDQPVAAPGV